jgi:hypothetical protein
MIKILTGSEVPLLHDGIHLLFIPACIVKFTGAGNLLLLFDASDRKTCY